MGLSGATAITVSAHRPAGAIADARGESAARGARGGGKGGDAVRVTPHVLRHSYSIHAHANGTPPRDLQDVLGHGKLETTMCYLKPSFGIQSPLDAMAS